jgi:hypothetical protein
MTFVVAAKAGALALAACVAFAGCSKRPKEVPPDTQAEIQRKMQEDMAKVRQKNPQLFQGQQQKKQ